MATMSLWSIYLHPGKPHLLRLEETLLLTNVALTDQLQEASGRTSIRITTVNRKDELESTFVLCSLIAGQMEQYSVHITIHPENTFVLEAIGPNAVYLSGNYIDEFANMRSIRDALKQTTMETLGGTLKLEYPATSPDGGSITPDLTSDINTDNVKKRRRTSPPEAQLTRKGVVQVSKGKEVEYATPSIPRIQWADFGKPGTGDRTVAVGDFVAIKYKLKSSKGLLVSDNVKSDFLRFKVSDMSARVPQGFHVGLVGMKLGAQRIIMVPLELALNEANIAQFMNPPQAYRIECIMAEFTRSESLATPAS